MWRFADVAFAVDWQFLTQHQLQPDVRLRRPQVKLALDLSEIDEAMDYTERKMFQETGQKPQLFYVIFGFESEVAPSKEKHRFGGLPDGLALQKFDRPEHSDYINGFLNQDFGKFLDEKGKVFAESVRESKSVMILHGEVLNDQTLDYLRDAVGLVESMLEKNAAGVLDLFSLKWMNLADWKTEYFSETPENLLLHVVILFSHEVDGIWLHTRGMTKFGRPDISIKGVPEGAFEQGKKLANRLIGFHIAGGLLDIHEDIRIAGIPTGVHFKFVNDPDNEDFNNVYFEASWPK